MSSPMTVKAYNGDQITEAPMSPDQVAVIEEILKGSHQIYRLFGGAGVGKSAVIDYLKAELGATVCATTARAALNVHGCTVDSLFAFSRHNWTTRQGQLEASMENCGDWIILDEASMVGARMASLVYDAVVTHNKHLVLVGDWAQAPPVKDIWPIHHPLLDEGISLRLTTNHRQCTGPYLDCLKEIRSGTVSPQSRQLFGLRVTKCPQDDQYTYMYGTNKAADAHNTERFRILLEQTRCPPVTAEATFLSRDDDAPDNPEQVEKVLLDSRLAHRKRFCVGARVMTTINNYEEGFVNGDLGWITSYFSSHDDAVEPSELRDAWNNRVPAKYIFHQKYDEPIGYTIVGFTVRLERTGREVLVPLMTEEMHKPNGEILYVLRGLPVRLGYAMTVHKTQGATLDRAFLAMNSLWWEHGLAYVGLSRTRSLEGLLLEAWRPDYIYCDPKVIPYL